MESKISVEPKINSVQNYLSFPGMVFDSGSRSITLMASNRVLADRDVTPRLVLYLKDLLQICAQGHNNTTILQPYKNFLELAMCIETHLWIILPHTK